jgi:hypothetical protein
MPIFRSHAACFFSFDQKASLNSTVQRRFFLLKISDLDAPQFFFKKFSLLHGHPRRAASTHCQTQQSHFVHIKKIQAMFSHTSFRFALIAALAMSTFTASAVPTHLSSSAAWMQIITLTAGTQVNVMLNELVDSESVTIGNALDFTVRSNVMVNGKVLIAAGATATGWVKNVKKACGGKCVELTITVESATAVDGQTVNLRSIPHIVRVPCCDGSTTANIGTNLTAHVLNDLKIND